MLPFRIPYPDYAATIGAMQAGWSSMEASRSSMQSQVDALTATVVALVNGRIKYAKVLVTAADGIYSGALGSAGLFSAEPVIAIVPKMGADNFDWRYSLSGTP